MQDYSKEAGKVKLLQEMVESGLSLLSITLEECNEQSIAQKILLINTKNELEEQLVLIPQTSDNNTPSKSLEPISPLRQSCNRILDILHCEYTKWKHNYNQLANLVCKICTIYEKLLPSTKIVGSSPKSDRIQLDNSK